MNINKAPFRIAVLEAFKSKSRFRVGCVLAKGDRIISSGFNKMDKTCPTATKNGEYSIHAEIAACRGLRPYDVAGASAYVCRILQNGALAMAGPCEMCRRVLRQMGIKKVYYSTSKGWEKETL